MSSRHTTWLPIHVARSYIMPCGKSEATAAACKTVATRKYRYPGQSLAEFYSPSIALCNAPFNAPCSPVTPLLLVIAWYCTVLPCAPSSLLPQSLHTAQQAIVVCTEASARGQGCDFEVEWIQYAILACPRDLPLLPVFGLQQLEMKIAHPGS